MRTGPGGEPNDADASHPPGHDDSEFRNVPPTRGYALSRRSSPAGEARRSLRVFPEELLSVRDSTGVSSLRNKRDKGAAWATRA